VLHSASMRLSKALRAELSKAMRAVGRKGGKARAANLSPEQRSAGASHAAKARWAKARVS
jgi:hypothetical protein